MQLIRPLQAFLAAVAVAVVAPLLAQPWSAEAAPAPAALVGETPTTTTLKGTSTYAGSSSTLTVTLRSGDEALPTQPVLIERRVAGT